MYIAVVWRDPRTPFSAALGLAATLGLTFFGVSVRWIAVAGGTPEPPLILYARPCYCACFFSIRRRAVLCRSQKSNFVKVGRAAGRHLFEQNKGAWVR